MNISNSCIRYMSTMPFNQNAIRSSGFALPTVIFLMVIVAMLLGTMVKLSTQQSASVDLALLSARADLAARSALEWATYEIRQHHSCASVSPEPSLAGFTISVENCQRNEFQEGTDTRVRYDLDIIAESAGGDRTSPDYAFRKLDITLMVEDE